MNPIKSHGLPSDTSLEYAGLGKAPGQAEGMLLRLESGEFRVLGQSNSSFGGMSYPIAWVQGDADNSALLFEALTQSYGERLSNAVAQGFGLTAERAELVPHGVARHAVMAADVGQQALAGVDFLTRLEVSASRNGSEFRHVCASLGLSRASLSPAEIHKIDELVSLRFNEATRAGATPVEPLDASEWLKIALSVLTN